MNNYWKASSLILALIVVILGYYVYKMSRQVNENGVVSIDGVEHTEPEMDTLRNPNYAKDINDYLNSNLTSIAFTENIYDFDTINQGDVISRKIHFVNTGEKPFFITDINVTCGCTIPVYTNEPVQPKDTGFFTVDFNSAGKDGFSMNKLTVHGNIEKNETTTYFKVFIKKK